PADVVQKISTFLAGKPVSPENARLNLQPLLTLRRSSDVEFDSFSSAKPWGNVVILFGVAALILLVACVNYISMTAAGFIHRAREIGMRISLGAARGDIIRQLITESVLPALLAVFPAMAMVELLLPMADDPAVVSLPGDILFRFEGIAGLTAMALTTGLIAGIYPALRLSSLRPATVIKRPSPSASRGAIFQKILVIIQFTIAVFLIICALVIYRQHQYAQRKDLGYEKSEMIYTHLHDATRKNLRAIKRELRQSPHIIRMTTSTSEQTRGFRFSSSLWRWEGQRPDERRLIRSVYVGDDFFRTFDMDMVNGRYFVDRPTRGGPPAAIINEATAEIMGMHSPVGKHLTINDARLEIIGVIKNYHFRSLRRKIEPLIILRDPGQSRVLFIKIHSGRLPRALVDIRAIWGKYAPGLPFEYQLMDDALKNLYRFEEALASILRVFSFLAVLLSCLGLFGLASFIVERRTKEIGVRKALGASTGSIVRLLSREFAACVLIANLLACPMAAYFCTKWLGNYAYHVPLTPWPFLLAAALTFGTAAVAVSLQTIKAAAANPVDAIRCE
ncbi:MAG: FtsX-like permease family protein, partial [Desulfobacterales bacterium]|nr:FtsX-like permease family protein [Desulfobacterales bacterium]